MQIAIILDNEQAFKRVASCVSSLRRDLVYVTHECGKVVVSLLTISPFKILLTMVLIHKRLGSTLLRRRLQTEPTIDCCETCIYSLIMRD
jgi:hypothetical protein